MHKKKFLCCVLLMFVWTGVIFSFSAQTSDVSNETSREFGNMLWKTLFPWVRELLQKISSEQIQRMHYLLRKCGHFTEFFVLGSLAYWTFFQTKLRHFWVIAFGYCLIIASMDETLQLFVEGRSGRLHDVILDSFGAIIGIVVMIYLKKKLNLGRNLR